MANKLLLCSLAISLVLIIGVYSDEIKHYDGYTVYRLVPTTKAQLNYLHDLEENNFELDFWKSPSALNKPVDVMVPPHLKQSLERLFRQRSLSKITLIEDVEKILIKERITQRNPPKSVSTRAEAIPGFWNSYQRFANIQTFLSTINTQYPSITALESIGKSYEGRDLTLIRIGVGQASKTKPVIFLDCGIHAREWITPAFCTYLVQQLVDGYSSSDSTILPLLQKFDFYIVPVINPDGYEFTHTSTRLWRKTRKPNSGSTCIGTDANRNFAYQWGGTGASTNPCSDTYRGSAAFSEVETKALSDYITANKARVKGYFATHSYGQYWLYPWGYTSALTPDNAALNSISTKAVAALTAVSGTRYTIGTSTNVLYAAAGGADDWAYGGAGVKYSFTIELRDTGTNGFTLPASQIIPCSTETVRGIIAFAQALATEV